MSLSDIWGAKEDQWTPDDQMKSDVRVAALTCHGRIVTLQADFPDLTKDQIRQSLRLRFDAYRAVCNLDLEWFHNRIQNRERLFEARRFCETTSEQFHARTCSMIVDGSDYSDDGLTWVEYMGSKEESWVEIMEDTDK